MAELSIVPMKMCKQLEYFETTVGKYKVVMGEKYATCTCPSFEHQRGTDQYGHCKHIRLVDNDIRCYFHEQIHGPVGDDDCCPECGGELVTRMVGV